MTQASDATARATAQALERVFRETHGRVVAALASRLGGDLALAEDALGDATTEALQQWPKRGTPTDPAAWLLTVARRRAIDRIRREDTFRRKARLLERLQAEPEDRVDAAVAEQRLPLLFTCCHPALAEEARVALSLRTIAGLSTRQIADAFMVTETTMGQRISRAKRKIRDAGIPYRVPPTELFPERLMAVLHVIYLVFNAGHSRAGTGDEDVDLLEEALHLGRVLFELMPAEGEVAGLLGLMYLTHARTGARYHHGVMVPLEAQDRMEWDADRIQAGLLLADRALAHEPVGPFTLQAAIAAEHAKAGSWEATDWLAISSLYAALAQSSKSAVVAINHAVAVSFADGPEAGLAALQRVAERAQIETYQPFHAAHADLLRRAGRSAAAAEAYDRAIALSDVPGDVAYLQGQRALVS